MTAPTLPQDTGWMGDRRRGASLGRTSIGDTTPKPLRFSVQRLRLNSGGYDSGGAYWGLGAPLYWASAIEDGSEVSRFLRAQDRDDAKATIRDEFPNATFFR